MPRTGTRSRTRGTDGEGSAPGRGGKGRPIWSGTLSFGLISIPVALAPAVRDSEGRVAFHLLDKRDMQRLRRELMCPVEEKVVDDPDQIARGVEVQAGQWVTVEDDELRAAAPKRSTTIEILDFVPLADIDPLYYDHPYLVIPGSALKPYRLLVDVLQDEGLAGIARFVLHAREHYTAIRVLEDQLCLITLRYEDELRTAEGLELGGEPEAKLVKSMLSAIGKLKGKFDPQQLEDDTNEKVIALIKRLQAEGTEPKTEARPAAKRSAAKSDDDLSAALEASVKQARASRSAAKQPAAKTATKRTRKRAA